MRRQYIVLQIVLATVALTTEGGKYQPTDNQCPDNEVLQDSGIDCATCKNYMVVRCATLHERKCYCKAGYVRHDETNKCVPTDECPKPVKHCSINETFQESGYDCQTCTLPTVNCALQLKAKCYCKPGYLYDEQDNCILRKDCSSEEHSHTKPPSIVCGINENPVDCINPCQPTCERPTPPVCNFLVCNEGCVCKPGYVKKDAGSPCIPEQFCPKNCSKPNQEFNECASRCPPTCQNKSKICILVCSPDCACKKSYIIDEKSGECVLEKDCP